MDDSTPRSLLGRLFGRRGVRARARAQEPADMGTAFGLDWTMDELPAAAPALSATSAAPVKRRWLPTARPRTAG